MRFSRTSHPFRLLVCLAVFACLVAPVAPAFAGWHTEELGWHISRIGGFDGTSIVQRDTALTTLNGANTLDTTATFSFDYTDVQGRGLVAPGVSGIQGTALGLSSTNSDTTVAGFLLVQIDSTSAAVTNGTFTIHLEGKVGGYSSNVATNARGWTRVDSTVTTLGAVRDEALAIPIRTVGLYGSPLAFPTLRARTSGGTGIMGSVRVFFRYWKNDASNPKRP